MSYGILVSEIINDVIKGLMLGL